MYRVSGWVSQSLRVLAHYDELNEYWYCTRSGNRESGYKLGRGMVQASAAAVYNGNRIDRAHLTVNSRERRANIPPDQS